MHTKAEGLKLLDEEFNKYKFPIEGFYELSEIIDEDEYNKQLYVRKKKKRAL